MPLGDARLVLSGRGLSVGSHHDIGRSVKFKALQSPLMIPVKIGKRERQQAMAEVDRKIFFNEIRKSLFGGKLIQEQVRGIDAILDEWEKSGYTDSRWLAYMFATVYHEVGRRMVPVREGFADTDYAARRVVRNRKYGKEVASTKQVYYGRGLVQLTWFDNYKRMGQLLKIPLLSQPDLALDPHIATRIMFEGMTKAESYRGDFTGKSLEDYFNDKKTDWVNARQIINRLDRAQAIAGYAKKFYAALNA